MVSRITQSLLALLLFYLFASPASAQFQKLYAYDPGTGLETGRYHDVLCMNYVASNNVNIVTIGQSFAATVDGVVSYKDVNGIPIRHFEWRNPAGNPVLGETVTQLPFGNIAFALYDPVAGATDVVCTTPNGALVWITRLPNFRVRDVDAGVVTAYPSSEALFLVGHSVANNRLAIQGLDGGTGAQVFANEYFVVDPLWNFASTSGYEIRWDGMMNDLRVVGTANVAGLAKTTMIWVRTTVFGGWIIGRSYSNPGPDFYHGKALIAHPASGFGNYVLSFEHSNTGAAFDQVGMMEINNNGTPVWCNTYPGMGFFGGTNFISNGIDTDGNNFLSCGYFNSAAAAGTSGYSLAVNFFGNPIRYNEYETAGFYPPNGTGFLGMDWNTVTGLQHMTGWFTSLPSTGGWPQGPNPNSFWLVASDGIGKSVCSKDDLAVRKPQTPQFPQMNRTIVLLPPQVPSPLKRAKVDPRDANQCSFPKRFVEDEAGAAEDRITVTYAASTREFLISITGETDGQGLVQVLDLQGRVLLELNAGSGRHRMDASTVSNGIYLVRYSVPGLGEGVKKLVVR